MRCRKWTSRDKTMIILDYLRAQKAAEICTKYGIHQNQLYRCRDEFLKNAYKAFVVNGIMKKEQSLSKEIKELKSLIGELTFELKKVEGEEY